MVVVIHVHVGKCEATLREKVNEFSNHDTLLTAVMGPARVIGPDALLVLEIQTSEEEEIVLRRPEGVPFEVKEYVSPIGRWHQTETVTEDRIVALFDSLERRRVLRMFARANLEGRLAYEPLEILIMKRRHWLVPHGERGHRRHAG